MWALLGPTTRFDTHRLRLRHGTDKVAAFPAAVHSQLPHRRAVRRTIPTRYLRYKRPQARNRPDRALNPRDPWRVLWHASGQYCNRQNGGGPRRLGFDKVFDTDFAADLTIMEEASNF